MPIFRSSARAKRRHDDDGRDDDDDDDYDDYDYDDVILRGQ